MFQIAVNNRRPRGVFIGLFYGAILEDEPSFGKIVEQTPYGGFWNGFVLVKTFFQEVRQRFVRAEAGVCGKLVSGEREILILKL